MSEFAYREGSLRAEGVCLDRLAEALGTPFYCYSTSAVTRHYHAFVGALADLPATVYYACKANSNLAVLRTLASLGAGADVVSGGELERALAAGVPANRIVFSGVGKTEAEMAAALEAGIRQINAESEPEIRTLGVLAARIGRSVPVALRINPDVDADTHEKISTGKSENKFGVDISHAREVFARAAATPGIEIQGLALHIGSQITDLAPFRDAFRRLAGLVGDLRGEGLEVLSLDLGGGLGIAYGDETPPDIHEYAAIVREEIAPLGCELLFEPGRFLVANAGVLVTRVIRVKEGATRNFVVVDAAMNDLLRPALYGAYHRIIPVSECAPDATAAEVDVVGPVCESADTFARNQPLPPMAEGDLLAICSAGAYGAVMASGYNSRPLAPEVLVKGDAYAVIRPRQDPSEILALDRLPEWLTA